jgi:hypothetical protein
MSVRQTPPPTSTRSASGSSARRFGAKSLLIAGLAAVVAVGVLAVSWIGCTREPRETLSVKTPVDLTTLEPEHKGPLPVRSADLGLADDLSADPPAHPFADEAATIGATTAQDERDLGLPSSPPVVAGAPQLPAAEELVVFGTGEGAVASATQSTNAPQSVKAPVTADLVPAVETQVFGVTGRGSRFVYVFDRSLSMEGPLLAAAKRELLASISHLDRVHQFQIVFYNEHPKLMRPAPDQPPQMLFADENGKAAAESFVRSISAAGATDHMQALKTALRMGPDVVFFLTDADEPQLTSAELDTINHLAAGTLINAIQFWPGEPPSGGGFLKRLAEQNRGQYKHVDVNQLK